MVDDAFRGIVPLAAPAPPGASAMFPIGYGDLALMCLDREVEVDHTTVFR